MERGTAHWPGPDEPRRRLDTRALALGLSRNGRTPSARREMIEYLISRTMGNQRRHTASLLAVQSPPAVRLSVCLSYMQPVGIQGRRAPPVSGRPPIREYPRRRSERSLESYKLKARDETQRAIFLADGKMESTWKSPRGETTGRRCNSRAIVLFVNLLTVRSATRLP